MRLTRKKQKKPRTLKRRRKQHTHRRRWRQRGGSPITELQANLAECFKKIEEAKANYSMIEAYVNNSMSSCAFWLEQATRFLNRSIFYFEQQAITLDGMLEQHPTAPTVNVSLTIPDEFHLLETVSKHIATLCDETNDKQKWFMRLINTDGSKWMVQLLLLDPSVNPSADDNYAIVKTSKDGSYTLVDLLLQDGRADPSANESDAFLWASKNGHVAVVDLLLRDGRIDPTADNNYAIREASENGHLAVVDRLLQDPPSWHPYRGIVDPSAVNNYAIRQASYYGHLAVVDRLLREPIRRGVDPSADDNYAISMAYEHGDVALINRLLQDPRIDPSILDDLDKEYAKRKAWTGCSIQ